MNLIHKKLCISAFTQFTGFQHFTCPGTPSTIGPDLDGDLCVWYTTGTEQEFIICWTGMEIPSNFKLVQTVTYGRLVYHLAVKS